MAVLGSLIDAGANILGNILGYSSNKNTNQANKEMTAATNATNLQIAQNTNAMNQAINERNIAFQQAENELARQREDNAVQRRASDLVAAGLSKTLAAGSPAAANAMQAPQATIGMQTGHAMSSAKFNAFRPDIQTDFETAINHRKQNEIASEQLDLESRRLDIEEKKVEEEARHNQVNESITEKHYEQQNAWETAANNENARYHDEAIRVEDARLEIERSDFYSKDAQRAILNGLYESETKLNEVYTEAQTVKITTDLFESAARIENYLASAKLSEKELEEIDAYIPYLAQMVAESMARENSYNAEQEKTLEEVLTEQYNRSVAEAEGTTTYGTVVGNSAAAENKANRHTELGRTAMTVLGGFATAAVIGLLKGGPERVKQKMLDAEAAASVGIWPF